jgi:hypothetical protein
VLLARERLHDPDARDALLGLRGELGDPLLDLLEGRSGEAVEAHRGEHHEGHRQQRQRREPGLDREHHHAGEADGERVLGQEDEAIAEEETDRLEVDGRTRHELARLLGVEEAELERLQVLVDALAQVVLDGQGDLARDQPPHHREAQPQHPRADDHRGEREDRRTVAALDRVDRAPHEPRDQHRHRHRRPGESQRPNHRAAIGGEKPEQAPEGRHPLDYTK